MAASLLGAGLLLAGAARAQEPARLPLATSTASSSTASSTSFFRPARPIVWRAASADKEAPDAGTPANLPPIEPSPPGVAPSTPAAAPPAPAVAVAPPVAAAPAPAPTPTVPPASTPAAPTPPALPPAPPVAPPSLSRAEQELVKAQQQPLTPPETLSPIGAGLGEESPESQYVQTVPPGPERLFRLESEPHLFERMRQEGRQRIPMERINFPVEPILSREAYAARSLPPATETVEPAYVCYRRLYFEEKNSERYGWDLGFIQPFVSAGAFYWDVVTLPYHIGTQPCRKHECSAGYCLPGDPVPYLLYPPELSLTGAALEAGTIVALFAIFPG